MNGTPSTHDTAMPSNRGSVSRPRASDTVIEMMVTKELGDPFRRDALSKPVRHLEKYKQFV